MAKVEAFNYTGLPQVIKKRTGTALLSIEGVFKEPYSLLNPVFNISGPRTQLYLLNGTVNYFKIEGKFYFLRDYRIVTDNLVEISLHLDVLNTYRSEILNMTVMTERTSEGTYSGNGAADYSSTPYMTDTMLPISNKETFEEIEFPYEFQDREDYGIYVLITAQSGYTPV